MTTSPSKALLGRYGSKQSLAIKTNDAWFTQVALKEQAAKLFCSSLSREPADADINVSE